MTFNFKVSQQIKKTLNLPNKSPTKKLTKAATLTERKINAKISPNKDCNFTNTVNSALFQSCYENIQDFEEFVAKDTNVIIEEEDIMENFAED